MDAVHFILFNVYLACWLGIYKLIFSRKITFKINRFLLLGGIIISGILPFLTFSFLHSPSPNTSAAVSVGMGTAVVIPESVEPTGTSFPIGYVLMVIYWIGVLLSGTLFIKRWIRIHHYAKRFPQQKQQGYIHVILPQNSEIFSFGRYLFAPKNISESILEHEKVHIFQKHSLDNIFLETVKSFCWFNPAIYSYQKALKMVHEYLADHIVTDKVFLPDYAEQLVSQSFSISGTSLVHPFLHSSNLQKRLIMLKKKGHAKKQLWTYLMLLPLLAGTVLLTSSFSVKEQLNKEIKEILPKNHKSLFSIFTVVSPGQKKLDSIYPKPQNLRKITVVGYTDQPVTPPSTSQNGLNKPNNHSQNQDSKVSQSVDQMPQFPGGKEKMFRYFSRHILYPTEAKKKGIQGEVIVQFTVTQEGELEDIKTVNKKLGGGLEQEAVRLVRDMPKWTPGKQNGKAVNVQYRLPIQFSLQGPGKESTTKDTTGNPKVFQFVEKMPQFPGGQAALMKYLSQHIHYPEKAKKDSVQGTVVGQFVVEKDGSISEVKTVGKRKGDSLEEEVIRVINSMPKWIPGEQDGKKVRVQYTLPVRFTFPNQTRNTYSTSSSTSATNNTPAPPTPNGKSHFDASKPYTFVEDMPHFPEGRDSLMKFLSAHLKYPKEAREYAIQGTVVVQFIVNKDGSIKDVKAVSSKKLGYGLEKEAVRIVKEMPKWIPGKQDGKKVNVEYSLPIRFILQ